MTVTYFTTEIVALQEHAPVCDISKVNVIPCAEQCHSVLSQLSKDKEGNGSKFYYIQFPFGLNYKGRKEFQAYHQG